MERYIQALLNHRNRYTGQAYRDEPAIAVFEVINEPRLPGLRRRWPAIPRTPRIARRSTTWCAARGDPANIRETYFPAYRYELVRRVVDRLAKAIRDTGSRKPVVWNLNWPQMILAHEDVFQAVAESTVDAVSFCLYPGQRDVPTPYWEHPMDLSGKNYLPYLRQCYTDYEAVAVAPGATVCRQGQSDLRVRDVLQSVELSLPGHGPAVPRAGLANGHDVAVHPAAGRPAIAAARIT